MLLGGGQNIKNDDGLGSSQRVGLTTSGVYCAAIPYRLLREFCTSLCGSKPGQSHLDCNGPILPAKVGSRRPNSTISVTWESDLRGEASVFRQVA